MPKVSIIIPVYNVAQYLCQCMDSVVAQTLEDIEIICIDDCSTDNSLNILEEYAKKDCRIIVVKQQQNQGQGVARNVGIDMANGEYIGFVDPDDWVDTTMYEELYNKARTSDAEIIICDFIRFNENTQNYTPSKYLRYSTNDYQIKYISYDDKKINTQYFKDTLLELPTAVWHKIYKRDFIINNNISFTNTNYLEDVPFSLRAFLYAKNISFLNKTLYFYRVRNNSCMRQNTNFAPKAFYIFSVLYNILHETAQLEKLKHNFEFFIIFTIRRIGQTSTKWQKIRMYIKTKQYLDKYAISVLKKDLKINFWRNIFSVTNVKCKNKTFKVINVVGLKIKFRKKRKK